MMTHFKSTARLYLRLVAMLIAFLLANVWHSAFPWFVVSIALVIVEVVLDGIPHGEPRQELHFTMAIAALTVSLLLWNTSMAHKSEPCF